MTEALTQAQARIDHPEELDRLVEQIVAKVDPIAIYLFGSRARGDAREDSDYDLREVGRGCPGALGYRAASAAERIPEPAEINTWIRESGGLKLNFERWLAAREAKT